MFSSFAIHLAFLAYWIQAIVRDVRWRYANKVGIINKHSKSLDTIVCLCHQLTCPQSTGMSTSSYSVRFHYKADSETLHHARTWL